MRKKNTFGRLNGRDINIEDIRNFEMTEYTDPFSYEIFPAIEIEYIDGEYEIIPYTDWDEYEEDVEWLDRYVDL